MFLVASRASIVAAACAWVALLCLPPVSSGADTSVPPDSINSLAAAVGDSIPLAGRVVYLDFWASWCAPCRSSFPWMQTLQDKYRDKGFQVVTVNLDSDPKLGHKFLAEMKTRLPVYFDPKGALAKQYQLEVMPTTFVYGRDGKLRFHHEGFRPKEAASVESQITALLQEKATE